MRPSDGSELKYGNLLRLACQSGHALQSLGVKQGQTVLVWLPNGYECLRAWSGINMIGAVYVPINTAYRGGILQHVVSNAGASVAIVHASLVCTENLNTGVVVMKSAQDGA